MARPGILPHDHDTSQVLFFFSHSSFGLGLLRGPNSLRSSSRIRAPESLGLCFFLALGARLLCMYERALRTAGQTLISHIPQRCVRLRRQVSAYQEQRSLGGRPIFPGPRICPPPFCTPTDLHWSESLGNGEVLEKTMFSSLCGTLREFYPSVLTSLVGCFSPFHPFTRPLYVLRPNGAVNDRLRARA